ncbi:hypothetical protein [Burkholderia latens]|uniref:hypothetical protein n=1 Tax=Burkholderia latens TaxID=488446 RepID=UPI0015837E4C|nr:hypothetical protein [Burkholderia latens]
MTDAHTLHRAHRLHRAHDCRKDRLVIVLRRFAQRGRVKVFVVPRRMSRCTAARTGATRNRTRTDTAQAAEAAAPHRRDDRGRRAFLSRRASGNVPHSPARRRIGLTRGASVFARADEMLRASAHAIADAIRDGNLAAGTRLPSLQQIMHRVMPVDRASRTNK